MRRILFAVLGFLLVGALSTLGLTATFDTATITVTVNSLLDITVTQDASSITVTDPTTGQYAGDDLTLTVRCNDGDGYNLDAKFAWDSPPGPFPVSGIELSPDNGSTWTEMAGTDTRIAQTSAKSAKGGDDYTIDNQADMDNAGITEPADEATDVTGTVTFTVTAR